jgi:inositol phosphorylceramide mannosyltransferase catalytic subunit
MASLNRRRSLQVFLIVLALILVGTVIVLSSISFYLSIDPKAYLTEAEVGFAEYDASYNATALGVKERIPRIIHQTWKSETLPDRWKDVSQQCRDMMPD